LNTQLKVLAIIGVAIVGLSLMYFVIRPVLFSIGSLNWPCRPISLEEARNYYSCLSSISASFIGFSGLILGFLYFVGKQKFDKDNRRKDQIRKILDVVLSKTDSIDQLCNKILYNTALCVNDKKSIVADVTSIWRTLISIVENHSDSLQLKNDDTNSIVAVYSLIEREILNRDLTSITQKEQGKLHADYSNLMRQTRKVLYSKYFENVG